MLYTTTSLARAIFRFFDELENEVVKKNTNLTAGYIQAYLFGGCAVHLHINSRYSNDLDTELVVRNEDIKRDVFLSLEDIEVSFYDELRETMNGLEWDYHFNTSLASVSPDYKGNAILLNNPTSIIHVYLVSAVDLAVSKISRLSVEDRNDIKNLFLAGMFTLDEFERVAYCALDYSATPQSLQRNIEHIIRELRSINNVR